MKLNSLDQNRLWAMTGSVASGKSTVEKVLRELGAVVIDADHIAKSLTSDGHPFLKNVAAALGPSFLDPSGKNLNREKCRREIAQNPEFKKKLEGILHPEIAKESERLMKKELKNTQSPVFYSAALLIEAGRHRDFQNILLVTAPDSERLRRLKMRDHMTEELAKKLMSAQITQDEKRKYMSYEIQNMGSLEDLKRKVEDFYKQKFSKK